MLVFIPSQEGRSISPAPYLTEYVAIPSSISISTFTILLLDDNVIAPAKINKVNTRFKNY